MESIDGNHVAASNPPGLAEHPDRVALERVTGGFTRILNCILTQITANLEIASSASQVSSSPEAACLNQALSAARRIVGILERPLSLIELESVLRLEFEPQLQDPPIRAVLSPREREVLCWIAQGKTHVEVAVILGISERTVEQHVRNAKQKLNAVSTIQAVVEAMNQREIVP